MLRWPTALTLGVAPVAIVVALALLTHRSADPNPAVFAADADTICHSGKLEATSLPRPTSPQQAFAYLGDQIQIFRREAGQLRALAPPASIAAPVHAALSDEDQMLTAMQQMITRPDYVRLATVLARNPSSAPAWVRSWQAQQQRLSADMRTNLSRAGLSGCLE